MARIQIRAAGQQRYQTDALVKAAQYEVSYLLYCIFNYLMLVILSESSFSHCSYTLCLPANLSLAACLFLQPQHI